MLEIIQIITMLVTALVVGLTWGNVSRYQEVWHCSKKHSNNHVNR